MSSHHKGDRPETSVQNGDLLLAESVLQVVVVSLRVNLVYKGPDLPSVDHTFLLRLDYLDNIQYKSLHLLIFCPLWTLWRSKILREEMGG